MAKSHRQDIIKIHLEMSKEEAEWLCYLLKEMDPENGAIKAGSVHRNDIHAALHSSLRHRNEESRVTHHN